jgi:hypothetical protein
LGLGGLLWLGGAELEAAEARAARDIAAKLQGKDKQVQVEVQPNGLAGAWGDLEKVRIAARDFRLDELPLFTEPERSQSGRIGTLFLELEEFQLGELRVQSLKAQIPGSRFDFGLAKDEGRLRLSRSGTGTGEVAIEEDALADFIVQKFSEIKRATVKVYNDVVWVEGYGEFLLVDSEFTVIAKIDPRNGTELYLDEAKVYFNWRRAEPAATAALLQTLNPVIDLRKDLGLYDAVKVQDVRLRDGVLRATGETTIPTRPENQNPGAEESEPG